MKYPITILFLLLSTSIFSQREIIYDLDSYKQVVFKRSELVVSPAGSFSGNDEFNVVGQEADFLVNVETGIQHNKNINSQDEQYSLWQSANVKFAEGLKLSGSRSLSKRKYVGNRYLKFGYYMNASYDRLKNQNTDVKNNIHFAKMNGYFGLGFGRLEYVNHAWTALQILQSLENNSLLSRIPSNEEITAFADKIGTVSTSRILDFRLKDIAILETIIEYLIDNTLIDQLSTAAILIIEDTFEYDQIANRSSGSRLEFSLEPSSEYQNYNNTNTYNKDFDIGALGRISHISYKNIDVKWMQRIVYEAKLNFNNRYRFTSHAQLENLTLKNATAELNFRYGYSYLPNLRNNLSFYLYSGITMNASFRENQPTDYSSARLSIRLNASYNYYISPATQLVVSSELRYLDNEFQAGDFQPRISGELQFMLTHAIF